MNFQKQFRSLFVVCVISFSCAACAKPKYRIEAPNSHTDRKSVIESSGEYEVTVSANGKQVKNHGRKLVHYVGIGRGDVDRIATSGQSGKFSAAGLVPEVGPDQKVAGLRVGQPRDQLELSRLGLQPGDLITSFGMQHPSTEGSAIEFYRSIGDSKSASLTLLRQGEPHKVFYSLTP